MQAATSHRRLAAAFCLTGVYTLGSELLWTRLLGLLLGSDFRAVYSVVTAFFIGVALGAWTLNRRIYASPNPLRYFGVLQLIAALFTMISPACLHLVATTWVVPARFDLLYASLLLLPGSFCIGGMFVAIMSSLRSVREVGGLYAAETLGGGIGALLCVFILQPYLGLKGAGIGLGVVGCIAAMLLWKTKLAPRPASATARSFPVFLGLMALCGFLGLGVQIMCTLLMTQVLTGTVYCFTFALVVYLLGTSLGAFAWGRLSRSASAASLPRVGVLLLILATVILLSACVMPVLARWAIARTGVGHSLLLGDFAILAAVLLLPCLVQGALFTEIFTTFLERQAGKALAVNSVGAALPAWCIAGLGIPMLGHAQTYYAFAYLAFAVGVVLLLMRRPKCRWLFGLIVLPIVLRCVAPAQMHIVQAPEPWEEIERKEGLYGTVLLSGHQKLRKLQVNRYGMGGEFSFGEARMGHLPMMLSPGRERGLLLGMGTGVTASSMQVDGMQQLDVVELVPEVVELLPEFAAWNRNLSRAKHIHLHGMDARRFLLTTDHTYDLIVADLFHPARDGAGMLYTTEHFTRIAQCLKADGLFCQWIPLYQMTPESAQSVIHTFCQVFPEAQAWLGLFNAEFPVLGLVGSAQAIPVLADEPSPSGARFIADRWDAAAGYIAEREALLSFSQHAPVNRDLDPYVLFQSSAGVGRSNREMSGRNLAWLLPMMRPYPEAEVAAMQARHDALITYMKAEMELLQRPDRQADAALLIQYFRSFTRDPGFRPAWGRLFAPWDLPVATHESFYTQALQVAPMDPDLHRAYLVFLRRTGQKSKFISHQHHMRQLMHQMQAP